MAIKPLFGWLLKDERFTAPLSSMDDMSLRISYLSTEITTALLGYMCLLRTLEYGRYHNWQNPDLQGEMKDLFVLEETDEGKYLAVDLTDQGEAWMCDVILSLAESVKEMPELTPSSSEWLNALFTEIVTNVQSDKLYRKVLAEYTWSQLSELFHLLIGSDH